MDVEIKQDYDVLITTDNIFDDFDAIIEELRGAKARERQICVEHEIFEEIPQSDNQSATDCASRGLELSAGDFGE